MSLQRNKKELIEMVQESHYLPILASLLIGFVIAWSLWKPGFQEPTYDMHSAPMLARELPLEKGNTNEAGVGTAQNYGEFQPLLETPPAPETVERNSKLPTPELFVKTTPTKDGYLLSFSVTNFTIGPDGYIQLSQDDQKTAKVFGSPYFLDEKNIDTTMHMKAMLVTPTGALRQSKGKNFVEDVSFE